MTKLYHYGHKLMMLDRVFIKVGVEYSDEGGFVPQYIIWDDVRHDIIRYERIGRRASPAGGTGILYECHIDGRKRRLFFEVDRWFVEVDK